MKKYRMEFRAPFKELSFLPDLVDAVRSGKENITEVKRISDSCIEVYTEKA